MIVYNRKTGEPVEVYDISYTKGYPFFLIYEKNQWKRMSAKHYQPNAVIADGSLNNPYNVLGNPYKGERMFHIDGD